MFLFRYAYIVITMPYQCVKLAFIVPFISTLVILSDRNEVEGVEGSCTNSLHKHTVSAKILRLRFAPLRMTTLVVILSGATN